MRVLGMVLAGLFFVIPNSAIAQSGVYENTTTGTYGNSTASSCAAGNYLTRTITVSDSFLIGDVNLGFKAAHTWRTDTNLQLVSPTGTVVDLLTGAYGAANVNYNVTFDDEATNTVDVTPHTGTDSLTGADYYQVVRSEGTSLSLFDGQQANGTWTVRICDVYTASDNGTFQKARLYFTALPPTADLSVTVSASTTTPAVGANTVLTIQVSNAGPNTATGVSLFAQIPAGLNYISDTAGGNYNSFTGIWTLPSSIASGSNQSFQITASANASGSGSFIAEVYTSGLSDLDSTPNNRGTAPTEDDTASVYILANGTPGSAPTLTCPVTLSRLDWNTNSWGAGNLSGSYTIDSVPINIAFTGNTSNFQSSATYGGNTPVNYNYFTGDEATTDYSLGWVLNWTSNTHNILITSTFGTTGVGIEGLQFKLFDVDLSTATTNFIDRVTIYGYLNGAVVSPVVTNGAANSASGNTATGIAAANSNSGDGNVTVTFLSPVDTVRMYYDNSPAASSDPAQQGIGIHDYVFCRRGYDYSDAPSAFGSPSHLISSGIRLGAQNPDRESAAQPSATALLDDTTGSPDDEDGVVLPVMTQGLAASIPVTVHGPSGYLQAWIDFNGNNSFADSGEQIAVNLQDTDYDGTINIPVTVPLTATTSTTYARFRWSSTASVSATAAGISDGEVEDYALTINVGGTASLDASKTISVWDPGALGLYAVPGNEVIYTITVANTGTGATDANTIELVDTLPSEVTFYNGDIDDAGPEVNPVSFTQTSAGLSAFNYATDVAFSDQVIKPTNFAACVYTPSGTYDTNIRHICFNPKGSMASGAPDPTFSYSFRAKIN